MKRKVPLLLKLAIAAVVGIGCGFVLPDCGIRALTTFQWIFAQFVKFLVPFIILGFVTPAIAEIGKGAGKMLLVALAIAYASTLLAGYFSFTVSASCLPALVGGSAQAVATAAKEFPVYFKLPIPPVLDVVTSLVVAFMVGLGIVATNAKGLYGIAVELKGVVEKTLEHAFLPLLPIYVLTVIAELTASGRLAAIGGGVVRLMGFCLTLSIALLVLQYTIAGIITRRNPFKAMKAMLPAYMTGWGTCSSAATIPVTLGCVKSNDISEATANLVVPLCANIHLSGSMCNLVAYGAGILAMFGEPISIGAFTAFIMPMSIVAVASPGVPGGCVLAAGAFVESALGFTPERYALMVAIYMALDGMGTAANITGDGAIAMIIDKMKGKNQ